MLVLTLFGIETAAEVKFAVEGLVVSRPVTELATPESAAAASADVSSFLLSFLFGTSFVFSSSSLLTLSRNSSLDF